MRYTPIPAEVYIKNRNKLAAQLMPNSIAVLHANDIMPKDGDSTMGFWQNSDLLYLTGIDQEETILLLYPDAKQAAYQTILFIKETSKEVAIWEGEKYTQEEACHASGIGSVHWLAEFPKIFHLLMGDAEHVYLNTNEHPRATSEVQTRDTRFIQWCQQHYPLHSYRRLAPSMRHLRAVKEEAEIAMLKTACQITRKGFLQMLKAVKPGVMEYELEAELSHAFLRNRSRGFAYSPIVASGRRACILHYIDNSRPCLAGELILTDVAAEYGGYSADLTRVIPVSGKFTKRQKEVYNSVLYVMKEAKKLLKPGTLLPHYQQAVGEVMQDQLLKLGLLTKQEIAKQNPASPAYKKYFMHNTSHHLGLCTHDVADLYRPLEPGMVLTVEPGIYILEEHLGIRLENNVVIRENGVEDLMADIPLEAEEIEALVQQA